MGKIDRIGQSSRFITVIRSFYAKMEAVVRWEGSFAEPIRIRSGVLQGEPLSPYLFILFINDLISTYNGSDLPGICFRGFGEVHLLLYADDIVLLGEPKINLQTKINILKKFLETNYLILNENKSKIMVFSNGGRLAISDKWFWGERPLAISSKYNYLGYPLSTTISYTQHFQGKALSAISAVWTVMTKTKVNSLQAPLRLLDSMVVAVLLYAAPIWACDQKELLDKTQDVFLRRLLNLPRYTPGYILRMECGRTSLAVTSIKLTMKYWIRILNMEANRLPFICLTELMNLSRNSNIHIGLVKTINDILNSTGFSYLINCTDKDFLQHELPLITRTAIDQSIQGDWARINNTKLYPHYRNLEKTSLPEGYLSDNLPFIVKRYIAELRVLYTFFRKITRTFSEKRNCYNTLSDIATHSTCYGTTTGGYAVRKGFGTDSMNRRNWWPWKHRGFMLAYACCVKSGVILLGNGICNPEERITSPATARYGPPKPEFGLVVRFNAPQKQLDWTCHQDSDKFFLGESLLKQVRFT
ncbi:hypothetical protein LAZ67_20000271 [Cordylochernes scorpioides]|uniref:Reverse transcriptase domain-containing protein n=1 Tax=Cordylochernes scorpioides TaxID=51811 RepID=A0ABY6LJD0_9ARAC|nr:hypothetical protein LAZ67_20000271 [Cordylochernes scorpioides]